VSARKKTTKRKSKSPTWDAPTKRRKVAEKERETEPLQNRGTLEAMRTQRREHLDNETAEQMDIKLEKSCPCHQLKK